MPAFCRSAQKSNFSKIGRCGIVQRRDTKTESHIFHMFGYTEFRTIPMVHKVPTNMAAFVILRHPVTTFTYPDNLTYDRSSYSHSLQ